MIGIDVHRTRLQTGQTTALDEVDRIHRHHDDLACIEALVPRAGELARASDERRRAGTLLGPLDGIPFVVKANIDVEGVPTTSGLVGADPVVAVRDASVVARLVAAGAIPVAITTMAPLAIGAVTRHPVIGTCRSPRDPSRHAGGSSGGSGAAVGAGLVPFALGSDTMGSVRIPAAYCGVTAWLPTHGRLDPTGLTPLESSLDNIGVIAADPQTLQEVARVLLDEKDASPHVRVRGCDLTSRADTAGQAAAAAMIEAAVRCGLIHEQALQTSADPAELRRSGLILIEVEAAQTFSRQLDAGCIPDDIAALLHYGRRVSAEKVEAAGALLQEFAVRINSSVAPGDAIVLPTTPQPAPELSDDPSGAADLTAWVNVAGLPAVVVPVGDRSVQIVGVRGSDMSLLVLAGQLADQLPNSGDLRSRNADTPS